MKRLLLSTALMPLPLLIALAALISAPAATAGTLYWDVNGTGTGFSTVVGTWDGTNAFWNDQVSGTGGTPLALTTNADDLNIVTATINTGTITLSGARTASSITFGSGVGSLTISGGTSLTIGGAGTFSGIFKNSASAQTISTALILNTASTFQNNAAGNLNLGAVNMNGNALTFDTNSTITFEGSVSNVISGAGGIVKNGTGGLTLDAAAPNALHTFTGGITINGGAVRFQTAANVSDRGNVLITNGYLGGRFGSSPTFAGGLGTGVTAIQITGGTSGFSGEGSTISTFQIGTALSVLKWGATGENGATGFFNPTVLLLGGDQGMNTNAKGSLNNGIDLNGTNRTITSLHSNGDGVATTGFTISGVISNSIGTAGFEKTGVGNIILGNANTYNGTTTITGGILTVGNTASLGSGVSTNTLIFNGGTMLANAAFNSVATRGVTMTSTGIINTNTFAVGILGNITGAGGLTKNSTGTLTLSGTNSFGGVTTVNAGTLAITKEAALASNTSANLNVKSGAALQLNVDSAGTAGFTSANLNTLLGNISVANLAAQGLQAGAILALDTSTASGGTFTQGNALINSTGAFGGPIGFVKAGTGTLVFNQANTYTGGTTISGGTLQLNSGGSLAGGVTNNSIYLINQNATTGTAPLTNIVGSGSVAVGAGSTITINSDTGFSFNALNTTGGGSFALSGTGATTPTLGGLVGTSGNLSSAFSSGYTGGVTNLTLNTPTGTTFTYGGVIDDGATGMHLTKIGGGTQTLTGTNTYTGTTFLNGGTLAVGTGATIGKITGSTALTFNGGTLQFNRSGTTDVDAFSNSAPITVNISSIFGVTSNDAGNANANETVGAVTLNAGQMSFGWTNSPSSGGQIILTSLSRSGTASATFNGLHTAAGGRWKVTSGGSTTAGQIIGPWYTTGGNGANFASTDYAILSSDFIAPAAIAGSAETAWTTAANAYTMSANQTLTAPRTITALRNTNTTTPQLTLATGANLETYGVLNGAANATLTIAPGTGGVLTTPSGGGNLYITSGPGGTGVPGAITVSAPINNNGGNVTLVKNGSGTLTLSSTTSNYSGGTVINAGTLAATADTNLGATAATPGAITAAQAITVNGNATLTLGTATYNRSISIANGANAHFSGQGNTPTITGAVTGAGSISTTGGNAVSSLTLSSTGNTFTGGVTVGITGGSSSSPILNIASLVDTTSPGEGNILFSYGTNAAPSVFNYMASAIAPLTLNNRQIVVGDLAAGNTDKISNLNTTYAITINSNLLVTTTFAGTHTLNLDAVAGPTNEFNGKISDGGAGVSIAVSKTGAGTWNVTNSANSYTGTTSVNQGNLNYIANSSLTGLFNVTGSGTLTLSGNNSGMTSPITLNTATGTASSAPRINVNSATALGTGLLTFGGGAATDVVQIDNTSAGAVAVSTGNAITMNRNFTFVGTQDLSLGTGTTTLGGMTSGSNRSITVTAKTLTLNGTIAEAVTNLGITKTGAGTLVLSGPSNSYTGATTVSAGTLVGIGANAFGSTSGISIAAAGTLSLRGNSNTNFAKTSDSSLYTVSNSASGATINVDRVSGAGAVTLSVGNLTTTSTAAGWGLNFTGANGVSLSAGALTTPVSTAGSQVHTITNDISGGGTLTLASVFNQATTVASPDLVFTGTGNTIVTGAITQTLADMELKKSGTGTLTLNGTNTYTGGTTINAGTLILGNGGTSGSLSTSGLITNNGALSFNRSDVITQGTEFGSLITGSGKIVQSGSGTTKLTGTNSFTGDTDILSGTLEATAVDTLKNTSSINISGGTLLLSGAGNRIKDTAGMVVTTNSTSVPALSLSGSVTESVGALTLTSSGTSVIDLGTGTAVFTFANSSGASWSGLMQIWNWSGTLTGGGSDQLFFGSSSAGLTPAQLANITFVDPDGLGSGSYGAQLLSTGELVPVPEPSPLLASGLLLGIVGMQRRRRTTAGKMNPKPKQFCLGE